MPSVMLARDIADEMDTEHNARERDGADDQRRQR